MNQRLLAIIAVGIVASPRTTPAQTTSEWYRPTGTTCSKKTHAKVIVDAQSA
jgi:hypothetical protein